MTTPRMWPQIRKAAAAAREMLVDLAAQKWTGGSLHYRRGRGESRRPAGTKHGFGELTKGQKLTRTIPAFCRAGARRASGRVAGTSVA